MLELISIIEEYLDKNDVDGLRAFLKEARRMIMVKNEEARKARLARLARSVRPIHLNGYACYDPRELYYAFSRQTVKRLGLE